MSLLDNVKHALQHSLEVHLHFDFHRVGRPADFFYSEVQMNYRKIFLVTPPPPDALLKYFGLPLPNHIDALTLRRTVDLYSHKLYEQEHRVRRVLQDLDKLYGS